MIALTRYAETNVVTRAMRSERITRDQISALAAASSVADAWSLLAKTPYGKYLREPETFDSVAIESALRRASALRFRRATRKLHGAAIAVAAVLDARWELDALQIALRLWHGRELSSANLDALTQLAGRIPFNTIARAANLFEVAALLEHLPYARPIRDSIHEYEKAGSIFFVEVALEKDYYGRLLAAIHSLGGDDARAGETAIGAEIDIVNLTWLGRLLTAPLAAVRIANAIVPGPSALSRELSRDELTPNALEKAAAQFMHAPLAGIGDGRNTVTRLAMLGDLAWELHAAAAHTMSVHYPFRITCVIGFYLTVRLDQHNLCAAFAAKSLGLSEKGVASHLHGFG